MGQLYLYSSTPAPAQTPAQGRRLHWPGCLPQGRVQGSTTIHRTKRSCKTCTVVCKLQAVGLQERKELSQVMESFQAAGHERNW